MRRPTESRSRDLRATGLVLGLALAILGGPGVARASEFRVTTGSDPQPDGCTTSECSLREAVLAANASDDGDVVVVRPRVVHRLSLAGRGEDEAATGDLDVLAPLELVAGGPGRATIDGLGLDRVLDLYAPVKLEGLRITSGLAQGPGGAQGAGVRVVDGRFELRDAAIIANRRAREHGRAARRRRDDRPRERDLRQPRRRDRRPRRRRAAGGPHRDLEQLRHGRTGRGPWEPGGLSLPHRGQLPARHRGARRGRRRRRRHDRLPQRQPSDRRARCRQRVRAPLAVAGQRARTRSPRTATGSSASTGRG